MLSVSVGLKVVVKVGECKYGQIGAGDRIKCVPAHSPPQSGIPKESHLLPRPHHVW